MVKNAIQNTGYRDSAVNSPKTGKYNVVLSAENVKTIFEYYLNGILKLKNERPGFKYSEPLNKNKYNSELNKLYDRTHKVGKYVYDLEQKVYNRYKDGKVHIDEYDNKGVTAKNIIIQEAETKTIDNDGRLAINLIGKGKGKFITNGKVIDITWKKESRQDKTIFSDIDNNEIILNPGITWIQVTKTKPNITIE